MAVTKEMKAEIVTKFGNGSADTGKPRFRSHC